jgi:hypothetical protein
MVLAPMCYDSFMDIELARELRDAGFSNIRDVQHRQGREFLAPDGLVFVYSLGQIAPSEDWFIPTLDELIEACADDFDSMYRRSDGSWLAASVTYDHGDAFGVQHRKGESKDNAEEAVARLWLALHATDPNSQPSLAVQRR